MAQASKHRAGFVALLGRPNVGKSTLVNAWVETKVSIVSPKPETTRNAIRGIVQRPHAQIILVDTPGLGSAKGGAAKHQGSLKRAMHDVSTTSGSDADVALIVTDLPEARQDEAPTLERDADVITAAQSTGKPIIVVVNKIDVVLPKQRLLPWMELWAAVPKVVAVVPISAKKNDGLLQLENEIVPLLPKSPALFDQELFTDQSERFLCAELVREQLLLQLQQEIPHGCAVVIESFEDSRGQNGKPGMCHIEGRIIVERESHKGIVVGQGGSRIKAVSQSARKTMEETLGCKVFLRLTVHVEKDWTQSEGLMAKLGLDPRRPGGEE